MQLGFGSRIQGSEAKTPAQGHTVSEWKGLKSRSAGSNFSPLCQVSLSLRLYVAPDSDSHQGPGIIQSLLHKPFLCLLHLSGGALAPSLLPPSSFLQSRHTIPSPSPPFQTHPTALGSCTGKLTAGRWPVLTPPKGPGRAPSPRRNPALSFPLDAQGPPSPACFSPLSPACPQVAASPLSPTNPPWSSHDRGTLSGSEGEGQGSFTDHVATTHSSGM